MPVITVQAPLNQPEGTLRLLEEIRTNLLSVDFADFYFITAFAKEGPLLKLKPELDNWLGAGKSVNAMFGIDEKGTSTEVLQFALTHFTSTQIARVQGGSRSTFHPKIYFFVGQHRAVAYIGSNNLTPGGTETNAESFVKLDLAFPADQLIFDQVRNCWDDTLRICLPLNTALLASLTASGQVISEVQMRTLRANAAGTGATGVAGAPVSFPRIPTRPASPVPRTVSAPVSVGAGPAVPGTSVTILNSVNVRAVVIQIVPHHNGEIFLSKIALNQNPAFFGFPFTGLTVPKIAGNPAYPQRTPDPIVNLNIYDANGNNIHQQLGLPLNMVYYTTKSDIRITINPTVAQSITPFSILHMEKSAVLGADYDIDIYHPGSLAYVNYLAVCNQTMPSGGNPVARRFGWI